MGEAKFEAITSRVLTRVRAGSGSEEAWLGGLGELYPVGALANQVRHSCPKWAFCVHCHRGYVRGVAAGCCPEAEGSSSAAYALRAVDLLRANPALAADKGELKRSVFGERGAPEYRTPNDEVDVLLALWAADAIEPQGND